MQYLLMIYLEEEGWSRLTPAEQEQSTAAYFAYTDALTKAGAYAGSNRLQPVRTAARVRVGEGKTQVLDGPYSDSKEQLGGYYLIDVADQDAAIAWAARCPAAAYGQIEVRPVWIC